MPPALEPASPISCAYSSSGARSRVCVLKPLPRHQRRVPPSLERIRGHQRPGRRHRVTVRPSLFVRVGGPSRAGEGSSGVIVVATARKERTRSHARKEKPFGDARGDGDGFVAVRCRPLPSVPSGDGDIGADEVWIAWPGVNAHSFTLAS